MSLRTRRLTTRVLFSGADSDTPVLFLHGDCSSATWWEESMAALPAGFRGIAPDQRGYGKADPSCRIDARFGLRDLSDDAAGLMDYLGVQKAHIVGCSMGGAVVWRMMSDYPERFISATLVNPVSPFGFGGTKDSRGTPNYPDFAGSGAGMVDPAFVQQLVAGDEALESKQALREGLRNLFTPPMVHPREDALLASLYQIHLGDRGYPGDYAASRNWPYFAPGVWGSANACSPKHAPQGLSLDPSRIRGRILWIRGGKDQVVSDQSPSDPAVLGRMGLIGGWPGLEQVPPQPMLRQTRYVLEKFAAAGGEYAEVELPEAGHLPFMESAEAFNAVFHDHVRAAQERLLC